MKKFTPLFAILIMFVVTSFTAEAAVKESKTFKVSVTLPEAISITNDRLSANFQVREINLRTRSVQYTEIVRNDVNVLLETIVLR